MPSGCSAKMQKESVTCETVYMFICALCIPSGCIPAEELKFVMNHLPGQVGVDCQGSRVKGGWYLVWWYVLVVCTGRMYWWCVLVVCTGGMY